MTLSRTLPLILASQSPYRQSLLSRLGLDFEVIAPQVDETPSPLETPRELAQRLSHSKAMAVHEKRPDAIVIGSDQVASHLGQPLGKPHTIENACSQLASFSGQSVIFYTGLTLMDGPNSRTLSTVESYRVDFRTLSDEEIHAYVTREQPLDTAGSFYMEKLGIALFERMIGDDPTILMGLPLIRVCEFLREFGVDPL